MMYKCLELLAHFGYSVHDDLSVGTDLYS
jgi:hypothetical protein